MEVQEALVHPVLQEVQEVLVHPVLQEVQVLAAHQENQVLQELVVVQVHLELLAEVEEEDIPLQVSQQPIPQQRQQEHK